MSRCRKRKGALWCAQPALEDDTLCSAHRHWESNPAAVVDPYYEDKIFRGIKTPTWDWMTEAEAHAVVNGRYRGDGRRIDQWTNPEPMNIDTEAFQG